MRVIDTIEHVLSRLQSTTDEIKGADAESNIEETMLWGEDGIALPPEGDFTPIRRALRDIRFDPKLARRDDLKERKRIAQGFDQTLNRDFPDGIPSWRNTLAHMGVEGDSGPDSHVAWQSPRFVGRFCD